MAAAATAAAIPASAFVLPATAGASGTQSVKCIGNGDFCGASISIAGGASNKVVSVFLTDTDFVRVGVRVIPAASRGAFSISHASFTTGGSVYRFTLNAVRGNPTGARIILLFAAGVPA
ncbi:MAG: hypothetical protein ACLP01_30120 [Solirubrobacteraceae bacterium]